MHVVKQRKGIKRVHFGQGRFVYLVLAAVDWNKREKICPGDSFEGPGVERSLGKGARAGGMRGVPPFSSKSDLSR